MRKETVREKIVRIESRFAPKIVAARVCRDCSLELNPENQYPSCRKRGQHCCKKCWNQRFYYAVRKGKYGISINKIDKILESQKYKCAICESHLIRSRTAVDHCHADGRVRGLLCTTCNSGIGMLQDSTSVVANALRYLRQTADIDLRNVDFGEAPTKPPLKMAAKNIRRRAYVAANIENIRRIDREYAARKKAKLHQPRNENGQEKTETTSPKT